MMMDLGLLIVRLVVGLLFAAHGCQKLFGWFGGYGLKGTGGWFESIGMKPGVTMALLAGLAELVGGALLATGVLLPLGALGIILSMLIAIIKVHGKNGLWATSGGFEYNLVLIAVALGLWLTGPGAYVLIRF